MRPHTQETANLVTFTKEILNGKLHFLCSVFFLEILKYPCSGTQLTGGQGVSPALFGKYKNYTDFVTKKSSLILEKYCPV